MIRQTLKNVMEEAIAASIQDEALGPLDDLNGIGVVIERPRSPEHGDYACGVALKLAGKAKMPPLKIASEIASRLKLDSLATFDLAPPGYINFRITREVLEKVLLKIHREKAAYGRSVLGAGKRVLIEYVSANPTGDLHIGHGRNAVYGSCLANLMKFCGFDVEEEFYVNDAGTQVQLLGACSWALYKRLCGQDSGAYPDEGYPEDTLLPYVEQVHAQVGSGLLSGPEEEGPGRVGGLVKGAIMERQKEVLAGIGVTFDRWFSETTLHQDGRVDRAIDKLHESQLAYESEGAFWLKARELGDERDRVLVKSDGKKTYLCADAAYHLDKYSRGYDLMINIWGADHHGQIPGLKAAIQALGEDPSRLEVVLTQIVNLLRDGQIVRMSKRRGTVVLLEELVEEVGRDAVRYYLAETGPQNPISFDLELAKKSSKENPAFYIQYAHARCCAVLRRALEPVINTQTGQTEPPPVSADEWESWQEEYRRGASAFSRIFEDDPEIFAHQKELIKHLSILQDEVEEALLTRQPGRLARYAYDVATALQKFYEVCRFITADREVTRARLGLVVAVRQVLANVLSVIGVTPLERM